MSLGAQLGLALLSIPLAFAVQAWALAVCWDLFVSPFLHWPLMGLRTAVGLRIAGYLFSSTPPPGITPVPGDDEKVTRDKLLAYVSLQVVGPIVIVGAAYLWHAAMPL